jgi:cytochrome c biogenesis protein CcmG/thiol:disulfide interchange protein DsbE
VLIWAPLLLFAAVFALVAGGVIKPGDRLVHSAMVGKPLPAMALPALVPGKPGVATAELRGKPRLLNVFASWCIPCIAEAPQLMKLKQAGVEIDAVAVRDTPEAVQAFLARNGDPYARIGNDKASRAQLALGSSGVPETFVIDAQGRIAYQHIGDIRAEHVPMLLGELEKAK